MNYISSIERKRTVTLTMADDHAAKLARSITRALTYFAKLSAEQQINLDKTGTMNDLLELRIALDPENSATGRDK